MMTYSVNFRRRVLEIKEEGELSFDDVCIILQLGSQAL
ncbi:hypothetical protein K737_300792 [Holospora undulata HU1]|uniref:Uncharacterized protein n=1 Tax=Holospora undulata HU1 TaxID=1321371 RepID=A0A061JIE0_9PROT|nr:hypothetical protein K737_300792 [Holospora undulata HU1]